MADAEEAKPVYCNIQVVAVLCRAQIIDFFTADGALAKQLGFVLLVGPKDRFTHSCRAIDMWTVNKL
jgi:hypothetical protein